MLSSGIALQYAHALGEGIRMKSMIVGLVPVFLLACGPTDAKDSPTQSDSDPLPPPPLGQGIQLGMTKTIAPGNESYGCQLFQMPDEDLFIHEQTVRFSRGGHHILLYKTPYTTIPERDENGTLVNGAEVHDCSEGVTAHWKVDSVLGGSEIFDHPGMFRGLPEGVAVHLPRKTIVAMSVHYLNASAEPVTVDARANLSTIPREKVTMEAGLLYLDNHVLHVPPMGTSIARMHCPIPSDVFVVNLQSHMHERGTSFAATVVDEKGRLLKKLYETKRWIEPPVESYHPFLMLRAGETLETRCDYENPEARAIVYGPRSSDEMCQLIGPYFPRDPKFEACANAQGEFAAQWVGHGLSDGVKTHDCLCGSPVGSPEYVACVFDACPAIADRVSAVVRCELAQGSGACDVEKAALSQATCHD
jgi:hypothetical protein